MHGAGARDRGEGVVWGAGGGGFEGVCARGGERVARREDPGAVGVVAPVETASGCAGGGVEGAGEHGEHFGGVAAGAEEDEEVGGLVGVLAAVAEGLGAGGGDEEVEAEEEEEEEEEGGEDEEKHGGWRQWGEGQGLRSYIADGPLGTRVEGKSCTAVYDIPSE